MSVIDQGIGKVFTDPDADSARAFFRSKSRAMESKLMTVHDAVKTLTQDGDYLVVGGFGVARIPTAVCHELVREGRKNMGLAGHTATHDFQILCVGKVFNRCDVAYVIGLEARGLSPNARRYMESGEVEVSEWTNYSLSARLKAAAMGVSFVPTRNVVGTDTFKYSGAKLVTCPFTGALYVAMPALYPDVGAIHVHEADIYGNCRMRGITVSDLDLARAAKKLIVTTERIISNKEIRRDPTSTVIPYYLVDAICEVPYGSYPGNMYGEYFSDEEHLREWLAAERDPDAFKVFVDKNIYNCTNHFDYLEVNGGLEKMRILRHKELMLAESNAQE